MDWSKMTIVQLKEEARERGLKKVSALKKSELIDLLEKSDLSTVMQGSDHSTSKTITEDISEDRSDVQAEQNRRARQPRRESNEFEERERRPRREKNESEERERRPRYESNESEERERQSRRERNESVESERRPRRRVSESDHSDNEIEEKKEEIIMFQDVDEDFLMKYPNRVMKAEGIFEKVKDQSFGFIRCDNYLSGNHDVYVSHSQIRKFNLKTGDILRGNVKFNNPNDKFAALIYIESVNGYSPYEAQKRSNFEDLTPIFPNHRIKLEIPGGPVSVRMLDLLSPIGKGQRGMIVSQPKTGKTTLLKQIAKSILQSEPDMKLIVLLIDERPEEVTDIRESIEGKNAEVIYSTFDELPEHHCKVAEMVLERAKRLVEHKEDVVILLDSITRLARAYNLGVTPSGRTLSGGLDPAALHMPKKFFGAARNMREGGSLTVLATALVETGSKMDDVVFEEFKGTGNMEVVLDRKLAERRIFPAINIQKSGTRREDLLLSREEQEIAYALHREMSGARGEDKMETILKMFRTSNNNEDFIRKMKQSLFGKKNLLLPEDNM